MRIRIGSNVVVVGVAVAVVVGVIVAVATVFGIDHLRRYVKLFRGRSDDGKTTED